MEEETRELYTHEKLLGYWQENAEELRAENAELRDELRREKVYSSDLRRGLRLAVYALLFISLPTTLVALYFVGIQQDSWAGAVFAWAAACWFVAIWADR